jgi:hypothetical protein
LNPPSGSALPAQKGFTQSGRHGNLPLLVMLQADAQRRLLKKYHLKVIIEKRHKIWYNRPIKIGVEVPYVAIK